MLITERFIAMALRLMEKFIPEPNAVWVSSTEASPSDPNKPWDKDYPDQQQYNVRIVFYPPNFSDSQFLKYMQGLEVPTGVINGIMAVSDEFEPDIDDRVVWEGEELTIRTIQTIKPINNPIVHIMEFHR